MIDLQRRINQATTYVHEGNTEQAICAFENIIADHIDFEACYSILCDLYLKTGRTNFPDEWIKRAVKFDPSFNESFLTLTSELQSQGKTQEAVRILSALVEANPNNQSAWHNLGIIISNAVDLDVTDLKMADSTDAQISFPDDMVKGKFLPPMLSFEVCNKCNASCIMCDGRERTANVPFKQLNIDELKRKLEGVEHIQSAVLTASCGEPFLNKDIVEIVRLLKKRKAIVDIITNGSLINQSIIEKLLEARLDRLMISIHGATAKTAEAIMPGVSFDGVIANINEIKRQRSLLSRNVPKIELLFVGMRRNICELSEMVELAVQIGVNTLRLKSLLDRECHKEKLRGENLVEHPKLLFREYERAKAVAEKCNVHLQVNDPYNKIIASENCNINFESKKSKIESLTEGKTRYCLFPFLQSYIDLNSVVALCCSESGRSINMGNTDKDSFGSIWNSDGYTALRKALLTGKDLPEYCIKCERAPVVNPFVLQMDIASRQIKIIDNKNTQIFLKRNLRRYPEYARGMKSIGKSPQKLIL